MEERAWARVIAQSSRMRPNHNLSLRFRIMRGLIEDAKRVTIRDLATVNDGIRKRLAELGVAIVTTRQPFGGERHWFTCPRPNCRRRCTAVYLSKRGLSCRQCAGLAYRSQRMRKPRRMRERAFKLFDRINVDCSQYPRVPGPKPARMQWRTYWRIYEEAMELDARAVISMFGGKFLDRMIARAESLTLPQALDEVRD